MASGVGIPYAAGRVLYVGGLTPCREALLDGLRAQGAQTERLAAPERPGSLLEWCDLVLYAPAGRRDLTPIGRLCRSGRGLGAVLRPEDKGLAPASLRAGARAIFVDEVQPEEVLQFARSLGEEGLLRREVRWLRTEVRGAGLGQMLGTSAAVEKLRTAIKRIRRRHRCLLLQGEKGSAFLQVAKALHAHQPGLKHPFLHWEASRRDAGEVEKTLARLEAFRGEEGDMLRLGGTLFVEDAQLLPRPIQERLALAVQQVGVSAEFRLLLGRSLDPERLIQEDLLDQLAPRDKAAVLRIPPLRERRKDIPQIAARLLDDLADRVGESRRSITPAALEWFAAQPWWGNEAELQTALWRAYLTSPGCAISLEDLTPEQGRRRGGDMEAFFRERLADVISALKEGGTGDFYEHTIRSVERPLFELVLRECGGNQVMASRILGMNRNTLRRKLQELGLAARTAGRASGRRR